MADPEGVDINSRPQFLNIPLYFHGIFKKDETKSAKRTRSSTHLNPPSRNPGSAPETYIHRALVFGLNVHFPNSCFS